MGKFKPLLQSLTLKKEIRAHNLWHEKLFANLFAEEVILIVRKAFKEGNQSAEKIIPFLKREICHNKNMIEASRLELEAWRKIFGDFYNYRKIRKIIFRDWTYSGVKAVIENKKVIRVMIFPKNLPSKSINRILENLKECKNIQVTYLKNNQLWKII